MSELLQFLISGITVGAIYSVVALGFTMIYNASGVVNFAQGEFVMLGAMLSGHRHGRRPADGRGGGAGHRGHEHSWRWPCTTSRFGRPAVPPCSRWSSSPLERPSLSVASPRSSSARRPRSCRPSRATRLFGSVARCCKHQSLVVVSCAFLMFAGLHVLMTRTLVGRAVVATATNRMAAQLSGINVELTVRLSFALSAAIGALSGVLIAPITLASYDMGTLLALRASRQRFSAAWATHWAPSWAACSSGCSKPCRRAICHLSTRTRPPS